MGEMKKIKELPKRAWTATWENGVLTLDHEKELEVAELTPKLMEQLAGFKLCGFNVKKYPLTDDLLKPFTGHKDMANIGLEDCALTDACFEIFATMPKLSILRLEGNKGIHGTGLNALQECKIESLNLRRSGLNDSGLLQAAGIPKLYSILIDDTAVTFEGLLAIASNSVIRVNGEQFSEGQMDVFYQLQRDKAKKNMAIDEQAAEECRNVLYAFFEEMTAWEAYVDEVGFKGSEVRPRLMAIWEKYVSEKPRPGYNPLNLSYSSLGTYKDEKCIDAEQLTKSKIYLYAKKYGRNLHGTVQRFLMKKVGDGWKIDAVHDQRNGWERGAL